MRTITRTNARRPIAIAIGIGVAVVIGGCTSPARTAADRRADEVAIAMQVGPPLPDAVVWETPWYRNAGVWYDHRSDVRAVLDWLEELPRRLGCERCESDDLTPPVPGRSQLYRVTCHLDRNGRSYVVSLQTLLAPTYASTIIAVYREPG